MTLLSILGCSSIAVPMSSGFPANELRYILDNSETLMLLSSEKFKAKAEEVLKGELETKPMMQILDKRRRGSEENGNIQLETVKQQDGGMMLYTSGTTSRPVSTLFTPSLAMLKPSCRKACCYPNQS